MSVAAYVIASKPAAGPPRERPPAGQACSHCLSYLQVLFLVCLSFIDLCYYYRRQASFTATSFRSIFVSFTILGCLLHIYIYIYIVHMDFIEASLAYTCHRRQACKATPPTSAILRRARIQYAFQPTSFSSLLELNNLSE